MSTTYIHVTTEQPKQLTPEMWTPWIGPDDPTPDMSARLAVHQFIMRRGGVLPDEPKFSIFVYVVNADEWNGGHPKKANLTVFEINGR